MSSWESSRLRLSDRDLAFVIEAVTPEISDKANLNRIIREDEDFRNSFISDEKVFRKLMEDDAILLKISPVLFFEILLRKAAKDLANTGYTFEQDLNMRIPVFDTQDLVALLEKKSMVVYLADMLSSFTRIESYVISVRIGQGFWRKIRFNDLDIRSLMALCDVVEEPFRFSLYKRVADICLFMLGVFPEYAVSSYKYPHSGKVRPKLGSVSLRINPKDYEKEGRKFYKLAAEHPSAREIEMDDVFRTLYENFLSAKKPLNFISEHYLQYKRQMIFA